LRALVAALSLAVAGTAALPLGGCHALPLAAFAAGNGMASLGWLETARRDAPILLDTVKPITAMWCADRLRELHTPAAAAALGAFCNHLPSDVAGLLAQLADVALAVALEEHPL